MTETDSTDYNRFVSTASDDQHAILADCEVDARTHGPDKASTKHTHEETHVIFMRTGEMHWEVDGERFHATAGDTIVTPAGVEHRFEVVGGESSKTLCLIAPARAPDEQGPSGANEITKPEEV